jgi:hypothetical protein
MTVSLIPTPMPVVLSTAADAEAAFGKGSPAALRMRLAFEGPRPSTCSACGAATRPADGQLCDVCRPRWSLFDDLEDAFRAVGRCVDLVEAHATALFESDGSSSFTLTEWRALAFHHLARLSERSPDLLPFGRDTWGDS